MVSEFADQKNIFVSTGSCPLFLFQMSLLYLGSTLLIASLQDLLSWTVVLSGFCSSLSPTAVM